MINFYDINIIMVKHSELAKVTSYNETIPKRTTRFILKF